MREKALYMVVDRQEFELPSAIGNIDEISQFLGLSKSGFYKLISKKRNHTNKYLILKMDDLMSYDFSSEVLH